MPMRRALGEPLRGRDIRLWVLWHGSFGVNDENGENMNGEMK
jgi:hypothetical protein